MTITLDEDEIAEIIAAEMSRRLTRTVTPGDVSLHQGDATTDNTPYATVDLTLDMPERGVAK